MAAPPSASVARVENAAHAPDTVRPGAVGDSLAAAEAPPRDPRVDAIVAAYRAHYRDELARQGSAVADGVDPVLVALAKRRTAADYGYADPQGWAGLVASLEQEGRYALAEGIEAAHHDLAAGGPAEGMADEPAE